MLGTLSEIGGSVFGRLVDGIDLHALDTNGFYALGIPGYLLLILFERAMAKRQGLHVYHFAETMGNFSAGLGEVVIGLFLGPYLLWLYDFGVQHLAIVHWAPGSPWPWIIAFFAADFGYYVYHRAGHRVAALWAIHGVHHQAEEFNVSVATRHPWFADLYSFVFYIHLPMLGVSSLQFFVAISVISFYALIVHSRVLHRPGFFILTTPQTHIVHHCKNPRYIGRNLGAMFTLWDRLFGTHVEVVPEDPPQIGTRVGYRTHDGALSQWILFRDLFAVAKRTPRWQDKLRVFVTYPGWLPPGVTARELPGLLQAVPPRQDATIPLATKRYVGCALAAIIAFSMELLWYRSAHPLWMQLASTAVIMWSLWTIGGLLDGRKHAVIHEAVRLGAALVVSAVLVLSGLYPVLGVVCAVFSALSLGWLLWTPRRAEHQATQQASAMATAH